MKSAGTLHRVHFVRWRTPLEASHSPYLNRMMAVQHFSYARFQAALDLVRADSAKRVLDFGCWDGHFLPSLLKCFEEVWGIDDDSTSVIERLPNCSTILQVARRLCESEIGSISDLRLTKATGTALPFPDSYFDVVFCLDTLAHIPQSSRLEVIHELRRITKPAGQLIFSLPVETGLMHLLREILRTITRKQTDPESRHYDFRSDLELLHSQFTLCEPRFIPMNALRSINPTVLVDCQGTP
jgi:SAM-dependent methyltransferase